MSEYISRNEACQELHEARCCDMIDEWGRGYNAGITEAIDRINNFIPPADVAPVVHGHWIWNNRQEEYECSACGWKFLCSLWVKEIVYLGDYCPHCGAKMDEEESGNA